MVALRDALRQVPLNPDLGPREPEKEAAAEASLAPKFLYCVFMPLCGLHSDIVHSGVILTFFDGLGGLHLRRIPMESA